MFRWSYKVQLRNWLSSWGSIWPRMLFAGGAALGLLLFIWLPLYADDDKVVSEEEEDVAQPYMEWLLEDRMTNDGPVGSLLKAWADIQYRPNNNDTAFWELLGPAPLSGAGARYSGRINTVAVDPRDPDVIYVGAALGGVWKTTNGGQSWTALTDDQPSLAMGALAINPANPEIIFAGTGEQNFVQDAYYGAGILRSTDGGTTWTRLGESVFVNPAGGGATISRVLIDPNAPATIYVASTYGLYKSTDNGESWALKLSSRTQAAVTDLIMDPTDSAVLYAALGYTTFASNKGLYRSTDGGETWDQLEIGLTSTQIGRVNIALAPSDPRIIYASVHNPSRTTPPAIFRLKSTDCGATWTELTHCTSRTDCAQGAFNNVIQVHPEDPDIVYQGAVRLFRSTDGGKTWTSTTRGHTDQHALTFDQRGNLYVGTDGGLFRVNTDDTTANLNSNLAITQFYAGLVLHPTNPDFILAGSQDNGSTKFVGDPLWLRTCLGDGMFQAIEGPDGDPDNVWYCSRENLQIRKTTDGGRITRPVISDRERAGAAFIAPYIVDPNNSNVLIAGTKSVLRTEDAAEHWELNSEPLATGSATIRSLAFAPLASATTYYAGTSAGRIWRTTDTGKTWTNVSEGLPSARVVTHIAVSPLDSNTVYATFSGFGNGHVFRTRNAGLSWTDISGDLPDLPATALLLDATKELSVLYVGTDLGVFRSLDDGTTWERYSMGLPNTRIEDLVYNPETGVLVASTHGRGAWRLNFGSSVDGDLKANDTLKSNGRFKENALKRKR